MENIKTIDINGWITRIHAPTTVDPQRMILMLHGWTGDEQVMWVFAERLPADVLLVAPRGPYKTPLGGYGWHVHKQRVWPWVDDFLPAIDGLESLLGEGQIAKFGLTNVSLIGFSQGAALAYAFAMLRPYRVESVAGLSGFLPEGAEALARNKPLYGKPVFIAHGTQDELVPVSLARSAVEVLESAGAQVTYCEDDVGHKLSANCFNGLEEFFRNITGSG